MSVEDFDPAWLADEIQNTKEDVAAAKDARARDKLIHRLAMLEALSAAFQM